MRRYRRKVSELKHMVAILFSLLKAAINNLCQTHSKIVTGNQSTSISDHFRYWYFCRLNWVKIFLVHADKPKKMTENAFCLVLKSSSINHSNNLINCLRSNRNILYSLENQCRGQKQCFHPSVQHKCYSLNRIFFSANCWNLPKKTITA